MTKFITCRVVSADGDDGEFHDKSGFTYQLH